MRKSVVTWGMWKVCEKSMKNNLDILGVDDKDGVMKAAKMKYGELVNKVPEFKENDVLLINILSACSLAAVYLSLEDKPKVEEMEKYYGRVMDEPWIIKFYMKRTNMYSEKYQKALKRDAEKSQKADNPYTWRYKYYKGSTIDTFDCIFDKCGIYNLFKDLGIEEIVPAMCAYDYGMAKYTNTIFTRESTIASGGVICDCHYRRKDLK